MFLESFKGVRPVDIDADDRATLHTVPFRLVKDKVVVRARINGNNAQDFVLDTGSEETTISDVTARRFRINPVTETVSAGVGEIGIRGLQLARVASLDFGTLEVRNVPVLVKSPGLRGMPKPEGESFSPLSIGLSMTIDYQKHLLTIGSRLPPADYDYHLPMRVHRLALVRGLLNDSHPTYFVVDTGGEVISISATTAQSLAPSQYRKIPLQVWGTSGWDRDAFLLPGRQPRLRPHRVSQRPAGRPQPAGAEPASRIPARRDRRSQVPGAVSRVDGSGAERAAAAEILNPFHLSWKFLSFPPRRARLQACRPFRSAL